MTRLRRHSTALLTAIALVAALVASLTTVSTSSAFTARVTNTQNTASTAQYFTCTAAFDATRANAFFIYPPSTNASTVVDASGKRNSGTVNLPNVAIGTGPCRRDSTNNSFVLSGAPNSTDPDNGYISGPQTTQTNPNTFTTDIWFKTTTNQGGRLIGFGNNRTGLSNTYDRHTYMSNDGRLWFGVYAGNTYSTITSPGAYRDGKWHLATTTLSGDGAQLYVDGTRVAVDTSITAGQTNTGYWRIGWDKLSANWPGSPTSAYFNGSVAYAAVYNVALTADQIKAQYLAGS